MTDQFLGEIRLFGFPKTPVGWLPCSGGDVAISQNPPLFSLIGFTYGGDGSQLFKVPDLRGRVPISMGSGPNLPPYDLGQAGGAETVKLDLSTLATHGHPLNSSYSLGSTATPGSTVHLATAATGGNPGGPLYAQPQFSVPFVTMAPASIGPAGGDGAHANIMPSLVANFCIATTGTYPTADADSVDEAAAKPEPYMGEIQAFAFNFGPNGINNGGWLPCDGRLLSVEDYNTLFKLIGNAYGGDGVTGFRLPDFNGRIPLSQGAGPGLTPRAVGEHFGAAAVSLSAQEMPTHGHPLQLGVANAQGANAGPMGPGLSVALNPAFNGFVDPPTDTNLATTAVLEAGNGAPHDNNQPTLALWYCICIAGKIPDFG